MKKIPFTIQLLAVMLVLGAGFLGFQAQVRSAADSKEAGAPFRMAVVDVQTLLNKSEAALSIQKQFEARREGFQKEISEMERKLKEEEQALVSPEKKMTEEEFKKKKAAFEKNLVQTRQDVQKKRKALEDSSADAIFQLRTKITEIVAEIADKEKYDVIITKQNVVLAVKSMDITSEVMSRLNDRVKKIDLKSETN